MTKRLRFWARAVGIASVLGALGLAYRPVVIEGTSMLPTLHDKQMVLMARRDHQVLHHGDIVVFRLGDEMLIKRVYAVGGDTLEMAQFRNGAVHLIATSSLSAKKLRRYAAERPWEARISRLSVPRGSVFVLGDNYNASEDSRDFGPVPVSEVVGKVVMPGEAMRRLPQRVLAFLPRVHARPSHHL